MTVPNLLAIAAVLLACGYLLVRYRSPLFRFSGRLLRFFGALYLIGGGLIVAHDVVIARGLVAPTDLPPIDGTATMFLAIGAALSLAGAGVCRVQDGYWSYWVLRFVARRFDRRGARVPSNRRVGPKPGTKTSPKGRPTGREFGYRMSDFSVGDVFWADVKFEDSDESKDRPLVMIGTLNAGTIKALALTSKPHRLRPGPYRGGWSRPDKPQSWVRIDRVEHISYRKVRLHDGPMHSRDLKEVVAAYERRHHGEPPGATRSRRPSTNPRRWQPGRPANPPPATKHRAAAGQPKPPPPDGTY